MMFTSDCIYAESRWQRAESETKLINCEEATRKAQNCDEHHLSD